MVRIGRPRQPAAVKDWINGIAGTDEAFELEHPDDEILKTMLEKSRVQTTGVFPAIAKAEHTAQNTLQ